MVWSEAESFRTAVLQLRDILGYVLDYGHDESISYEEDFFEQPILEDCTVIQCFEVKECDEFSDEKRMLVELIGRMKSHEEIPEPCRSIGIEFYPLSEENKPPFRSACGLTEYLRQRRSILTEIESPPEFYAFMTTCFSDSIFSDNVLAGLKGITNFTDVRVREAIVGDLGVLNDYALKIYQDRYPNFQAMYQDLGTRVVGCGPDPGHKGKLKFLFTYEVDEDVHTKVVCCSPHTKLLCKNSNLRIYFTWKDDDVAPDKVLIGHIGRHPY